MTEHDQATQPRTDGGSISGNFVVRRDPTHPDVSVVCPFYNEEGILQHAIEVMLAALESLDGTYELIVVDDGSVDGSRGVASAMAKAHPFLHLASYDVNRGRGYALRRGIAQARGRIVVTTEIDLSWGDDIVHRLVAALREHPEADFVVASPHLAGGGYKNVPAKRVFLSRAGNWIIRACMSDAATMNTGMTRAYRREMIQTLPLEEHRKEFHLEVIMKARALNYRMCEIPCVLEWRDFRNKGKKVERKSSARINRLIVSHTLFSVFANPIRYVWGMSGIVAVAALAFFAWGVARALTGEVSVFMAIMSLSLALIAVVFFTFGVIAQQGNMIQRELWTIKQSLLKESRAHSAEEHHAEGEERVP